MTSRAILSAVLVYWVPAALVGAFLPQFASKNGGLAFVLGAFLASHVATYVHWRSSGDKPTTRAKLQLGLVLAAEAVVVGALWQAVSSPFVYPDVVIGIAALGTPLFPLVFVSQVWKSLANAPRK